MSENILKRIKENRKQRQKQKQKQTNKQTKILNDPHSGYLFEIT